MLTRGFYGLQSNWLPTLIAVGTLVPERGSRRRPVPRRRLGHPARDVAREHRRRRASSSSSCGGASAASTCVRVADAIVRITLASAVLGAVAFGVWYALDDVLGRSIGAQIVSLGAALAARWGRLSRRLPAAPRARARRVRCLAESRVAIGSLPRLYARCVHARVVAESTCVRRASHSVTSSTISADQRRAGNSPRRSGRVAPGTRRALAHRLRDLTFRARGRGGRCDAHSSWPAAEPGPGKTA